AVTESDENNNSRTENVPVPTPPLPCATPTFTPTPAALTGPYAVVNVAPNDVLNIRSGAGSSQPVVGSFPSEAVNVMRTGPTSSVEGAIWVEVQNPSGGTGWVNSLYLTESVSHEAFCADGRVPALIEQLKGSVNQSNGDLLSTIVSPAHGVDVRLWAYSPPINFNAATAGTVFTSAQIYNWGSGGGTGNTDFGTFSQVIQPKLQEVLNAPELETYCDDLTKVFPLSTPWPYGNIRYYNLYKPASGQTFDFRTWLMGIEYINGQPYLHSMVSIVWEP
ncbi:MAG: SH3 domain-containing protein, partial [Syntrophothermus sp.]